MKVFRNIDNDIIKGSAVTVGFFDGVHKGHKFLISNLKKIAEAEGVPSMLITLWPHPQKVLYNKDIRLLNDLDEKINEIKKIGVDGLLILKFDKELAKLGQDEFIDEVLINKLKAKFLLKGFNNSFGNKQHQNKQLSHGDINIVYAKQFSSNGKKNLVNSTNIRYLLTNGDIEGANELLGYNFLLKGNICGGDKVGRKIGFPTANLCDINEDKLIPGDGVYIIKAVVDGESFPAMLNIGYRPTFGKHERALEFHILNFDKNIYGKKVELQLFKKIRNEIKFDSVEKLIERLNIDKNITESYFGV